MTYLASVEFTPTCVLPPNIYQNGVEGPSKGSKTHKTMEEVEKPKEVEEELVKETIPTKTSKGVLKRPKKSSKKPSDSETTKSTQEPVVETVEPIDEIIPVENPVPNTTTIT